jgi:hypothetical protein
LQLLCVDSDIQIFIEECQLATLVLVLGQIPELTSFGDYNILQLVTPFITRFLTRLTFRTWDG